MLIRRKNTGDIEAIARVHDAAFAGEVVRGEFVYAGPFNDL